MGVNTTWHLRLFFLVAVVLDGVLTLRTEIILIVDDMSSLGAQRFVLVCVWTALHLSVFVMGLCFAGGLVPFLGRFYCFVHVRKQKRLRIGVWTWVKQGCFCQLASSLMLCDCFFVELPEQLLMFILMLFFNCFFPRCGRVPHRPDCAG